MAKRVKKKCELGIPEELVNDAIAAWHTPQTDECQASSVNYIDQVPKYPTPGTPEYYRCMPKWYMAMQQAQMMNGWQGQINSLETYVQDILNQIGALQGQLNSGQPALDALVETYSECMNGGTPV